MNECMLIMYEMNTLVSCPVPPPAPLHHNNNQKNNTPRLHQYVCASYVHTCYRFVHCQDILIKVDSVCHIQPDSMKTISMLKFKPMNLKLESFM